MYTLLKPQSLSELPLIFVIFYFTTIIKISTITISVIIIIIIIIVAIIIRRRIITTEGEVIITTVDKVLILIHQDPKTIDKQAPSLMPKPLLHFLLDPCRQRLFTHSTTKDKVGQTHPMTSLVWLAPFQTELLGYMYFTNFFLSHEIVYHH